MDTDKIKCSNPPCFVNDGEGCSMGKASKLNCQYYWESRMKMLELAAFACGYEVIVVPDRGISPVVTGECLLAKCKDGITWQWNPLSKFRDGRAACLQMEVDLELSVEKTQSEWVVRRGGFGSILSFNPDRQLASTMAAAKIGEAMKNGLGK